VAVNSRGRNLARGADAVLEFSVVGSFSRVGPFVRRRLYHWEALDGPLLAGRVVIVSGATSGLGLECATQMARLGSTVVLLVRNPELGSRMREQIASATGNHDIDVVVADLGDLDSVRRAATELRRYPEIHGLVHNAGALNPAFRLTPQGLEETAAVQLVGPFLLTTLLIEALQRGSARVVWVTSGGMYAQPLDVAWLRAPERDYRGGKTYALVKRAQVSLNAVWAPDLAKLGVTMTAMHPGWVDTPGIRKWLPNFRRLMFPLLRSPAEGVDTVVWLLVAPLEATAPGTLWLDRRSRALHRLGRTERSDSASERQKLISFCEATSGLTSERVHGGDS
jgi:NAD(P)-dependent dehydrogenase (short-subunit alcohol dehydrogenase family)